MRELHVVALSSDGRHLVLSTSAGSLRGRYLLAVDPRLVQALNGELNGDPEPEPDDAPRPVESALSPKDIQSRLRAGETPEQVAKAAGVPVERVTRFYGPVLSERAQVIDAVREAIFSRARCGASAASLG